MGEKNHHQQQTTRSDVYMTSKNYGKMMLMVLCKCEEESSIEQ